MTELDFELRAAAARDACPLREDGDLALPPGLGWVVSAKSTSVAAIDANGAVSAPNLMPQGDRAVQEKKIEEGTRTPDPGSDRPNYRSLRWSASTASYFFARFKSTRARARAHLAAIH